MRIGVLTRYLIRAHLGPFLFALTAITGLIFLNAVAQRIDGLVGKGLPWTVLGEFLLLSLPHTIALSLPMSVLVAVLYAFGQLTASNEVTAMFAGGVKPRRIMLPVLGLGLLATASMLYFNDRILPESNHRLKNLLVDIGRKSPTLELREQVVNEIRTESGLDTYFLTAARIDPVSNTLEEVTIFDANNPVRKRTTYAARGEMAFNEARTDLYLTLFDGFVHEVQSDRVGGFQRLFFEKQIVPLRDVGNELERRLGGTERSDREMGFAMLMENAAQFDSDLDSIRTENRAKSMEAVRLALGQPTPEDSAAAAMLLEEQARGRVPIRGRGNSFLANDAVTQGVVITARTHATRGDALSNRANRFKVEIHKKWAIALACLVFTLIGPPLALRFPNGGVGLVIAASSGIFAIYWIGLIAGESMADRQVADPAVTMWMANVVFLIVGLLLVRGMGRVSTSTRGNAWDAFWSELKMRLPGKSRTRMQEA